MSLHFFAIPALEPVGAQEEFNRFCTGHRVVSVECQFVSAGRESFWALCATVASGPGPLPEALKAPEQRGGGRNKVDYRELLNYVDFAPYADLRAWRKTAAEQEGVPVYAVFSNDQLAEIVRRRVDSATALAAIEGVGPARVDRYGTAVLERLRQFLPQAEKQRQEAALGLPQQQPGFPVCLELDVHRVDARPMDQASSPVCLGACRGGELQGARSAGRAGGGCHVPKALRVADFFRWPS